MKTIAIILTTISVTALLRIYGVMLYLKYKEEQQLKRIAMKKIKEGDKVTNIHFNRQGKVLSISGDNLEVSTKDGIVTWKINTVRK